MSTMVILGSTRSLVPMVLFYVKLSNTINAYLQHTLFPYRMPEGPGRRPYRDNPFIVPSVSDYERI